MSGRQLDLGGEYRGGSWGELDREGEEGRWDRGVSMGWASTFEENNDSIYLGRQRLEESNSFIYDIGRQPLESNGRFMYLGRQTLEGNIGFLWFGRQSLEENKYLISSRFRAPLASPQRGGPHSHTALPRLVPDIPIIIKWIKKSHEGFFSTR